MKTTVTALLASAALIAPAVWALNMQIGEMLPYADCVSSVQSLAIASALSMMLAVASAAASYMALRTSARSTIRFLAGLGAGSAALFAFAIALQLAASLVISACQR